MNALCLAAAVLLAALSTPSARAAESQLLMQHPALRAFLTRGR